MTEESKMKDIAVIGSDDFTVGFELAGVREIYDDKNYKQQIQELVDRDDIGIVVTEQDLLEQMPGRIQNRVESSVSPVVVALSEDAEDSNLQEQIRKVIGADIS
ncbi:V-type ATP synthase subunit F [Candidatus Nanohalococcus occultus]|uniref:A-type ATP synthase subunit F n=1 Tax=Candidatus Nanohalococcus occultus TaxID=2978047 RepID=A0ABY8CK34_9ARCH|nr:Archaeal/vacuolar-type H -ATPase subunit F [Candidatus Nanohaloarchaeota archaeon SVXNc]